MKTENNQIELCPNPIVAFAGKPASELTKSDIIRFIREHDVKMVNFMYPAHDGRLTTLNFVINSLD